MNKQVGLDMANIHECVNTVILFLFLLFIIFIVLKSHEEAVTQQHWWNAKYFLFI